jgi:SAM-dependent methyltransferase
MSEGLFDLSEEYDRMLAQGLALSGESKPFFIAGRVRELTVRLPSGFRPRRVLDFGCGTGDTVRALHEAFPEADVVGVDTARNALDYARRQATSGRGSFIELSDLAAQAPFDLCYVNGVFHHIAPVQRPEAMRLIRRVLRPGGRLALFENNPWNPGTRLVMAQIPFDRDAEPLSALVARRLMRDAGFHVDDTRFLFYFPRALARLRFAEPWLGRLPLGAQYLVSAWRA